MMEDMNLDAASYRDAWEPTRVLPQLYETYKAKFRKESKFGFAGKTFFLAPDVDITRRLTIMAAGGVITDEIERADFLLGILDPSDLGNVKGVTKSFEWVEECLDAF